MSVVDPGAAYCPSMGSLPLHPIDGASQPVSGARALVMWVSWVSFILGVLGVLDVGGEGLIALVQY